MRQSSGALAPHRCGRGLAARPLPVVAGAEGQDVAHSDQIREEHGGFDQL